MARKPRDKEKVSVRINTEFIKTLDKLAIENNRDRSGEINESIRFYLKFANEAYNRGPTPEELQQWLFREVAELSKKYDRLEELVERSAEKNE